MDIIVFGDDWQSHVSTTQHLIGHLAKEHRVIWFNSLGMRTPTLTSKDIKRMTQKAISLVRVDSEHVAVGDSAPLSVLQPKVIPLHNQPLVQRLNRQLLSKQVKSVITKFSLNNPLILTVNPIVCRYLCESLKVNLCYLRLDNYALYGGVDQTLALATEKEIFKQAKHVFYTARELCPNKVDKGFSTYLPQGVDIKNFSLQQLPDEPSKVLGFFGLIEPSRYDFDLIARVANKNPDWFFEFIGNMTCTPERLLGIPNIIWRDAVPYEELSNVTKHWTAAWIPYHLNELTMAINPLKLREYLALGLPVLSTPLPEVKSLQPHVEIFRDENDAVPILDTILANDSMLARKQRRASVCDDSWAARSHTLSQQMRTIQTAQCRLQSKMQFAAS